MVLNMLTAVRVQPFEVSPSGPRQVFANGLRQVADRVCTRFLKSQPHRERP